MSKRLTRRHWLIIVGVIVLALLAVSALTHRGDATQYITAKVQEGEIRDAVEASGTVNAVINVQVGSQVSGTIAKLNADFNSRVHKDEIIAEIDPRLFDGALLQADADLQNARANVIAAKANLSKAKAGLAQTKAEFDRARVLTQKDIGSQSALDLAKANYQSAQAEVDASIASVTQADAQVRQKEAAVSVAKTNLNYTIIRSPIDGTVVARNVDVGQTVAASLQAPTIFSIAQDLAKMQVYAKVDESDVGRIRRDQVVTFKVDAFPKELFQGTVSQLRMNPTTVSNVVTYDAVIDFANPDLKLFPGMTAYVTIPVETAENVVKLPNAALRFKPPLSPEEVRALYAKSGIEAEQSAEAAAAPAGGKRPTRAERAVVWQLRAGETVEPVEVSLGITDHAYTEVRKVLHGALKPGDEVVTTAVTSKSGGPGQGIRR
ncbi:MAG TPA: efflux RND transporter periplasmic adaptor subunit [Thermoanaerobaculia bacterium]|jgi:HlyD family secretion protein|nr:efflux RND transporter periplasmic adaptor subunit [Thermoanaerobaculia bacterium]